MTAEFDKLWEANPRKVNKGGARKAFTRLSKQGILPPIEDLVSALTQQAAAYKSRPNFKRDGWTFFCHLQTWLNNERWADEVPVIVKKTHATASEGKYNDLG